MKHITEEQLEELRGALNAERDALEEELATYGRVQSDSGDWQGTNTSQGQEADPTDAADQMEELVVNVPLVEELEKRHKDIASALEKMEEGTYGICEVGEDQIPLDRLEANPASTTCVKHA